MSFNILFDYPFWIVLVCLVCAIIYSALLYYRNARDGFGTILRWVLAVFRFLAVSIIALLFLAPLIEKLIQQVEEPLIVFIQDNSTSLLQANESILLVRISGMMNISTSLTG